MRILKTVLLEVLGFVLLTVCGTVLGGFLFMLYGAATSYVIGSHINVFLPNTFLDGMLICFPPIMLFVPMLRMLSLIRHSSKNKLVGLITLGVLSFATWIFCVPICAKAVISSHVLDDKAPSELSAGYFREMNGNMYYFNSVHSNGIDGLKFENNYSRRNLERLNTQILKNEHMEFKRDMYGFSDPLVGESLEPPSVLSTFFFGLISMEVKAFEVCSEGFVKWLLFSSLMLALISVGAFISVSTWRLVCVFWILISTSAIIVLNYLYMNSYFAQFLNQLNERGGFFGFIESNFQLIMNCVIIVVLVLTGVVCTIIKNKSFDGDDL